MIIEKLIASGYLAPAKNPPANPTEWRRLRDCRGLTIPLIAEDYRALTAVMWNAAYVRWLPEYRNVMMVADPKRVGEILPMFAEDERYLGGGLGIGFKEVEKLGLAQWLRLDPLAEKMGSVNLVVKTTEGLVGSNTDAQGFLRSLDEKLQERKISLAGKRILILGAGGTANGIAYLLAERPIAELVVLNRTVARAENLVERINTERARRIAIAGGEEEIPRRALEANIIINASTKGADGEFAGYSALSSTADLGENLRASEAIL
ncbi:hypothetical protein HYV98_01305, partial [Candidatus Azambacteria bacterium]|nr:hypothetical protein [Candidatus Azambacteria bacterium]